MRAACRGAACRGCQPVGPAGVLIKRSHTLVGNLQQQVPPPAVGGEVAAAPTVFYVFVPVRRCACIRVRTSSSDCTRTCSCGCQPCCCCLWSQSGPARGTFAFRPPGWQTQLTCSVACVLRFVGNVGNHEPDSGTNSRSPHLSVRSSQLPGPGSKPPVGLGG